MAALGPWEPAPRLAAGVSGGADSTALALLSAAWAKARGGSLLALVVDHGLRPESATEAALTHHRLSTRGIEAHILTVHDLRHGSALAARARAARYALLRKACAEDHRPHLLLGHHAADQAETVMLRTLGSSLDRGLAAMPALADGPGPRLLRPLLTEPPAVLRDYLRMWSMPWVEDPSNTHPAALRARLRAAATADGIAALAGATWEVGRRRAREEALDATELATRAMIRPEGFAMVSDGPIRAGALTAIWRAVGGGAYPADSAGLTALARAPHPATLAGVRMMPAGRLGPGWLVVREERSVQLPLPAGDGIVWDRRFRLILPRNLPDLTIGALGDDAPRFRRQSDLPSAVLRVLPTLRAGNLLAAVPHLDYRDMLCPDVRVVYQPPVPMAGAPFVPAGGREYVS